MSSREKSSGGPAVAAAAADGGGSSDSNAARKRRRWSAVQEDLVPNRFVRKKQQRILGRQHPNCSSTSSLASFNSNSNPIFEPDDVDTEDVMPPESDDRLRPGAMKTFQTATPWNHMFPSLDTLLQTTGEGEDAAIQEEEATATPGDGRSHRSPQAQQLLLQSQASCGGGEFCLTAEEDSRNAITTSVSVGQMGEEEENGPARSLMAGSSRSEGCDGAQSVDGPRFLNSVPKQQQGKAGNEEKEKEELELESIDCSERRARELVERIQANAAADLAKLKAQQDVIAKLKAECAMWKRQQQDSSDIVVSRDAIPPRPSSVGCEQQKLNSGLEANVKELDELQTKCEILEKTLSDAKQAEKRMSEERDSLADRQKSFWKPKVTALELDLAAALQSGRDREREASRLEEQRDGWRNKAEKHERELADTMQSWVKETSEISHREKGLRQKVAALELELATLKREYRDQGPGQQHARGADDNAGPGAVAPAAVSPEEVAELHAEMATLREDMERLQRERNELQTVAEDEKARAEEAERERDAVCQAVRSEWDAVKVALREDKDKLEQELDTVRAQKSKLESELNARQKWYENKSLEVELVDLRDLSKQLEEDRWDLATAVDEVRDGNKKLEAELRNIGEEKAKLGRERDALITLREERQKIEKERADVVRAMQGENEKLKSERDILIAMQEYLTKLEIKKKGLTNALKADDRRRRKSCSNQDDSHSYSSNNKPGSSDLPVKIQKNMKIHTNTCRKQSVTIIQSKT